MKKSSEGIPFWPDLVGRIGAPTFAASLVGCLLAWEMSLTHVVLIAFGLACIVFDHWYRFHHRGT